MMKAGKQEEHMAILSIFISSVKKVRNEKKKRQEVEDEIEKLKAELARAKENHQYDNLVHQKELDILLKK